jgi:hypothetical protein
LVDEVGALHRQIDELRETVTSLSGSARSLSEAADSLRGELAATRDHALRVTGLYNRAVQEVDALRASWSWRLTGPLRFLGTLVQYTGRPRS